VASSSATSADQQALGVDHRQGGTVVLVHHAHRFLAVVGRMQGEELAIHQRLDVARGIGQQQAAEVDVVDQLAAVVDHEHPVHGLGVLAVAADVVERARDVPGRLDPHVIGGHQATDRVLVVAEDGLSDPPLLGAEPAHQRVRDLDRQLVEHGHAVVGAHGLDHLQRALLAQQRQHALLALERQVREHLTGEVARQQAEGHGRFLVGLDGVDDVGHVRGLERRQCLAYATPLIALDHLTDLGRNEVSERALHRDQGNTGRKPRRAPGARYVRPARIRHRAVRSGRRAPADARKRAGRRDKLQHRSRACRARQRP
jgi:hypothetical protein